jgi:hypothetical protein
MESLSVSLAHSLAYCASLSISLSPCTPCHRHLHHHRHRRSHLIGAIASTRLRIARRLNWTTINDHRGTSVRRLEAVGSRKRVHGPSGRQCMSLSRLACCWNIARKPYVSCMVSQHVPIGIKNAIHRHYSLVRQSEKPSRVLQLHDCSLQLAQTLTNVKYSFAIYKKSKASASAFWKCENESDMVAWLTTLKVWQFLSRALSLSLSLSLALSLALSHSHRLVGTLP